jgi:hypothetical protein
MTFENQQMLMRLMLATVFRQSRWDQEGGSAGERRQEVPAGV